MYPVAENYDYLLHNLISVAKKHSASSLDLGSNSVGCTQYISS